MPSSLPWCSSVVPNKVSTVYELTESALGEKQQVVWKNSRCLLQVLASAAAIAVSTDSQCRSEGGGDFGCYFSMSALLIPTWVAFVPSSE
ncbi:hypothetical protein O9929_03020 [Vibrio lentus]|nr:hypothetical protein [Vibrio lentus]